MAIAAEAPIMSFAQETPAPNAAGAGLVALTCGEKVAKRALALSVTICF